jgi:CRP-like cAMP-binding protein
VASHLENQLLARLDDAVLAAMRPHMAIVRLNQRDVINRTDDTVRKVYFPHTGIISCVVELAGGAAIETAMIGKDGQYGAAAALDHKISLNLVNVQIAGDASVVDADRFRLLAMDHPQLRHQAMAYEQFFVAQVQQACACNAVHNVNARTCKWLLRMQKLVGDELLLTQEFLAEMMGVRRTSVTEVAVGLQAAGMITYRRGRIRIIDLPQMRTVACECDDTVNEHYARLFERDATFTIMSQDSVRQNVAPPFTSRHKPEVLPT